VKSVVSRNRTYSTYRTDTDRLYSDLHSGYFLKRFANACLASVGAPEEVSRSTTVRGAKNSHVFRAFLFTMRLGIDLPHSKWAPGSK